MEDGSCFSEFDLPKLDSFRVGHGPCLVTAKKPGVKAHLQPRVAARRTLIVLPVNDAILSIASAKQEVDLPLDSYPVVLVGHCDLGPVVASAFNVLQKVVHS